MTPLKRARQGRNWTQKQVAAKLGINQGHYHRIESRGETTPATAAAIVALFGPESGLTEVHVLYPQRFAPTPQNAEAQA